MELRSVIARLQALSSRLLVRILATGTARILLLACGLALLTFLLDYSLRLPRGVRIVLLGLSLGLMGWVALRHLLQPLAKKPSIDDLALIAERADPSLKDQIISAVQLERDLKEGRAVESPELIGATIADTAQRFGKHSFSSAVSLVPCLKPVALAAAGILLVGSLALGFPTHFGLWVKRQLLLQDTPWPRQHTLLVSILDMEKFDPVKKDGGRRIVLHVPERTPLQVTVTEKDGNLPEEVELVMRLLDEDAGEKRIAMGKSAQRIYYQHNFRALMRSIEFYAEGGDDDDEVPVYEVRVARAPRITRFQADYDYPEYTGVQDRTLPDSNVSAPEGTRVTMQFETNMKLAEFRLEFESLGEVPLEPRPDGSYSHGFVVEGNDLYTYRLKGHNGVASADVPRYVVTAEVDQAPRVSVEMPVTTSLFVTPLAILPLKGVATDDYGVTEIGLRWGSSGEELDAGAITFGGDDLISPLGARQVPYFHTLTIKDLVLPEVPATAEVPATPARAVAEGDRFSFRFLVTDNRRTAAHPEPHKAFGDYEYQVQVLSSQDLQRELAQRQVRLRDRVRDIGGLVESRIEDTTGLIQSVQGDADQQTLQTRFWSVEQDQNRITIELQASTRQFMRVYDGYLWNRIEVGVLTDKTIATLSNAYRSGKTDDPFQVYGEAVTAVRPLIDESTIMGRLTVILDLLLRSSAELSPEAQRRLSRAGLVTNKADRIEQLRGALEMQRRLQDEIQILIAKLEAWEDYLDVVQRLRDLLDQQKGIHQKIKDLTNKK